MQRIKRIAEDNGFSSDGGGNDPSLFIVLKHVLVDLIGEGSVQGEYRVESGDAPYILSPSPILSCDYMSFCCVAGLCYAILVMTLTLLLHIWECSDHFTQPVRLLNPSPNQQRAGMLHQLHCWLHLLHTLRWCKRVNSNIAYI